MHNDTHVNAMDDPVGCASGLVQRFIADPGRLRQMNASCATRTPEVRVVGTFPRRLREVTAATARPGNRARLAGRRLAAAGTAAVGDAVWRWYYGDGVRGWRQSHNPRGRKPAAGMRPGSADQARTGPAKVRLLTPPHIGSLATAISAEPRRVWSAVNI